MIPQAFSEAFSKAPASSSSDYSLFTLALPTLSSYGSISITGNLNQYFQVRFHEADYHEV